MSFLLLYMFLSYFLGGYPEDYNLSSNNIVQINPTSTATLYENFAIMYLHYFPLLLCFLIQLHLYTLHIHQHTDYNYCFTYLCRYLYQWSFFFHRDSSSFLVPFHFSLKDCLGISYRTNLLATNYLSVWLSRNVLTSYSCLKDNFAR